MEDKLNILVVEDNFILSMVLKRMIKRLEHTCVGIAVSQEEAVELAMEHKPDIVIMDISLGEGSGIKAAEKIRKSLDTTILFSSGSTTHGKNAELISNNFDHFLPKPFMFEDLEEKIKLLHTTQQQAS